jgi:hypothetical protein
LAWEQLACCICNIGPSPRAQKCCEIESRFLISGPSPAGSFVRLAPAVCSICICQNWLPQKRERREGGQGGCGRSSGLPHPLAHPRGQLVPATARRGEWGAAGESACSGARAARGSPGSIDGAARRPPPTGGSSSTSGRSSSPSWLLEEEGAQGGNGGVERLHRRSRVAVDLLARRRVHGSAEERPPPKPSSASAPAPPPHLPSRLLPRDPAGVEGDRARPASARSGWREGGHAGLVEVEALRLILLRVGGHRQSWSRGGPPELSCSEDREARQQRGMEEARRRGPGRRSARRETAAAVADG